MPPRLNAPILQCASCVVFFVTACNAPTPAPDLSNVDCAALLEGDTGKVDIADGAWRGKADSNGDVTPMELIVKDGDVFSSLPERAQYNYPIKAATPEEDNVLCIAGPLHRGPVTLVRIKDGWRGNWVDPEFEATVTLDKDIVPHLPVERDFVIESADGARLAATLVLPAEGEGPFPVIAWVHGSSPTLRSTWFYRGRAHMMARHGVASVIWDKRGAGESTGEEPYSMERLAGDATAAVEAARDFPETDADGVIIAGFSQGGWLAPRVAANNEWLAGVLVGAAPGITISEQNLFSFRRALENEGFPAGVIDLAVSLLEDTYNYYRTGEGYDALMARLNDPENEFIVSEGFFRRFLFNDGDLPEANVDPAEWSSQFVDYLEFWKQVDMPILAMWGSDDNDVPPELSKERITEAVSPVASPKNRFIIFEDATHSLYVDEDEDDPWTWERTAPGFEDIVSEWVVNVVTPE